MIRALYRRNLNKTHLIIEGLTSYREDYQIHMIRENRIEGLLKFQGRGVDETSQYHYDVSGKVSVKALYEKAKITYKELHMFTAQLVKVTEEIKRYMLEDDHLLLDPEYIFYAEERFYFCYYPLYEGNLCEELHRLTEYFVSQVDYEDRIGIYMAYSLHKATMEENYCLSQIVEQIAIGAQEELRAGDTVTLEEGKAEVEEKHIREQSLVREHKDFNPFKQIWNRRRKSKWGEWEE